MKVPPPRAAAAAGTPIHDKGWRMSMHARSLLSAAAAASPAPEKYKAPAKEQHELVGVLATLTRDIVGQ